jgi:hypothetical protein
MSNTISRRTFIKGIAATPLLLGAPAWVRGADPLVRYDIASAQGMQMLAIYANAVRTMQGMGPDNPMSWMWQWYTHFVDGATTKANEITRIFGVPDSPRKSLATETWNTCQSHSGQNSNYFMPWHRMFVYYFERIVRQVSGRADFTLPYWDYTSADPAKRGIVPAQFRLPTDPVFGSLYRADRTSLANSGQPIHKYQPTDVMDISAAMSCANYSSVDNVMGFCRSIDSGIHGRIHVLVGTSKNMGAVPYAGRDPLFWVHHSNVDRMWTSWNANGGTNPLDTWSSKYFIFADANGVRVSRQAKSFFDTATLGYTYDALIPPPVAASTASTKSAATLSATGESERIAEMRGEADLGAKPVRVPLLPVTTATRTAVLGYDPNQSGKRTYLVLRDLHTWSQPEVLFHLYLSPAHGGALNRNTYVGNINFFDAEFHDHGNGALGDVIGQNFYSFDVTDILRRFAQSGTSDARDSLLVTIAPAGRPTGGSPMIGRMELVRL